MQSLHDAIWRGKSLGRTALYFGCWDRPGHHLRSTQGMLITSTERKDLQIHWSDALMDGGLLQNGNRNDIPDGKVFWTCGGLTFWYAFYWWDRSGDRRGASNSGFYVRGFGHGKWRMHFGLLVINFHILSNGNISLLSYRIDENDR